MLAQSLVEAVGDWVEPQMDATVRATVEAGIELKGGSLQEKGELLEAKLGGLGLPLLLGLETVDQVCVTD